MADVNVQQTPPPANSGPGAGTWILALVVLVALLLVAWLLFGGGGAADRGDVNVEVPQAEAPEVQVPEKIDVNVQTK